MRRDAPATEAEAYELLERLRWGGLPPSCPLCDAAGRCYFLSPSNGRTRATRTGVGTERRVWKCGACRNQFSVLAGTVLQGTRISLRAWIAIASEAAASGVLPRAADLVDRYGLSRAAAGHVIRRLALAAGDRPRPLELGALLRLPAAEAARIRARSPARLRPRPQFGPTADYGEG